MAELKLSAYSHTVAIVASSARGVALPPFVILRGVAVDSGKPAVFYPPEFKDACFFNSRGRRDEDVLLYWFRDHFLRCVPYQRGRPLVLLMARPVATDVSLRLVQLAADESVSLVCLPAGISHLLQPLSSGILRALDAVISSQAEQLSAHARLPPGNMVTPSSLASVLATVWNSDWPTADVSSAFADGGIYPLNVRAITLERIASSTPEDVEVHSDSRDQDVNTDEDDDDDDGESTDDAEHGLNLLSELSTMEQMQDSDSVIQQAADSGSKRVIWQRSDDSYYDSVYSKINRRRREPKVSEELMKRILSPSSAGENEEQQATAAVGSSRTRPTNSPMSRRSDVHVEIAAARSNYDQINRAVDSIVTERPVGGGCPVKRRPGRPRTVVSNKPESQHYDRSLKQNNVLRTSLSSNTRSGGGAKLIKRCAEDQAVAEVDYITVEPTTSGASSSSWLSSAVDAESATGNHKDVIEEVDLSDLYVNVDDNKGFIEHPQHQGAVNNNAKIASVAGAFNPAGDVVHCDLRQLASQLQPNQKVDVIQNVVVGGRTVQIIRRLTLEDVLRNSSSHATVAATTTHETVVDEGAESAGGAGELEVNEQFIANEGEDFLQVSMEETV